VTGCDICIESAFTVQCHKCSFFEHCHLNCTTCQDSAGHVGYPDLFSTPPGGCLLQSNDDYQLECRPGSEGTCSEPTSLVHATGNASFCRHTTLPPSCMLFAFFPIQVLPYSQGAAELMHIMMHLPNAKCIHLQLSYQLVTAHTGHAICKCCFVTSTVFIFNFGLITAYHMTCAHLCTTLTLVIALDCPKLGSSQRALQKPKCIGRSGYCWTSP